MLRLLDATKHFWVKDSEHPYSIAEGKPFHVDPRLSPRRPLDHVGAPVLPFEPDDFESNAKDGHGSDWPIRYDDLAPWYDHVETFAGISGFAGRAAATCPTAQFLPPMGLTDAGKGLQGQARKGRFPTRRLIIGRCAHLTEAQPHHRSSAERRASTARSASAAARYGAYFSSLSATLPAARATGNLTIVTDSIVAQHHLRSEDRQGAGVRVIDANTKEGAPTRRKWCSCAPRPFRPRRSC